MYLNCLLYNIPKYLIRHLKCDKSQTNICLPITSVTLSHKMPVLYCNCLSQKPWIKFRVTPFVLCLKPDLPVNSQPYLQNITRICLFHFLCPIIEARPNGQALTPKCLDESSFLSLLCFVIVQPQYNSRIILIKQKLNHTILCEILQWIHPSHSQCIEPCSVYMEYKSHC